MLELLAGAVALVVGGLALLALVVAPLILLGLGIWLLVPDRVSCPV